MTNYFKHKTILITGGTGTIGSKLVEALLSWEPRQIRIFSRDESKQLDLLERLPHHATLRLLIGDVRDAERLDRALQNVDIVFHAAAMKHVPFCEYNPFEVVKTNIIGSQNIIDAALRNKVKKVIAISTDKVVNPFGVMGVSKLMMEKLFIGANYYKGDADTSFSCVRFGNVTWARGSVLPVWRRQAEHEGKILITDTQMTRFFMSQDEAINLILEAERLMKGGEIFIFKMPAIRLIDLAHAFIKKYFPQRKIKIEVIGKRLGEKMHEELLGSNEGTHLLYENKKMFILRPRIPIYALKPAKLARYQGFNMSKISHHYSSKDFLSPKKINTII